jgi:hypothetical protein
MAIAIFAKTQIMQDQAIFVLFTFQDGHVTLEERREYVQHRR